VGFRFWAADSGEVQSETGISYNERRLSTFSGYWSILRCEYLLLQAEWVIVLEPAYDSVVPAIQLCGWKENIPGGFLFQRNNPVLSCELGKLKIAVTRKQDIYYSKRQIELCFGHKDINKCWQLPSTRGIILIVLTKVYDIITFDRAACLHILWWPILFFCGRAFGLVVLWEDFRADGLRDLLFWTQKSLLESLKVINFLVTTSVHPTPFQIILANYIKSFDLSILSNSIRKSAICWWRDLEPGRFLLFTPAHGAFFSWYFINISIQLIFGKTVSGV